MLHPSLLFVRCRNIRPRLQTVVAVSCCFLVTDPLNVPSPSSPGNEMRMQIPQENRKRDQFAFGNAHLVSRPAARRTRLTIYPSTGTATISPRISEEAFECERARISVNEAERALLHTRRGLYGVKPRMPCYPPPSPSPRQFVLVNCD